MSEELPSYIADFLPALYTKLSSGSEDVKRAAVRAIGVICHASPSYAREALHKLKVALSIFQEAV